MILRIIILLFLFAVPLFGYEISMIKVGGDKAAEIQLQAPDAPAAPPAPQWKGNDVEMIFPGATLHSSFGGRMSLKAPHSLVKQFDATAGKKGVALKITFHQADMKDKLQVTRDGQGFRVVMAAPNAPSPAQKLAETEQLPVLAVAVEKQATPSFGLRQITLLAFVLAAAAVATFFLVKFLQAKAKMTPAKTGNRGYLIEQLAYKSLGSKTGVSLIRIGHEFILLGVTPHQVSLLSALPAMQAQYEDDTQYERATFKDAVDEEIARLKKEIAL